MAFVPYRMALHARQSGRSRASLRSTQPPQPPRRPSDPCHPAQSNRTRNGEPPSAPTPPSDAAPPNLTRHATGGLKALYDRVRQREQQQRQAQQPPPKVPESFTRSDGHLMLTEALPLLNHRYRVISAVGEGTFSQLVLAEDTFTPLPSTSHSSTPHPSAFPPFPFPSHAGGTGHSRPSPAAGYPSQHKRVALKIMNSKYSFIGLQEVEKLCWLNGRDAQSQSHIVRLLGAFYFGQHLCLVLELLGCSLLSFMKQQPHHRVPIDLVRKIAWQMVTALAFVGSCNMIHGDIKPENVARNAYTHRTAAITASTSLTSPLVLVLCAGSPHQPSHSVLRYVPLPFRLVTASLCFPSFLLL